MHRNWSTHTHTHSWWLQNSMTWAVMSAPDLDRASGVAVIAKWAQQQQHQFIQWEAHYYWCCRCCCFWRTTDIDGGEHGSQAHKLSLRQWYPMIMTTARSTIEPLFIIIIALCSDNGLCHRVHTDARGHCLRQRRWGRRGSERERVNDRWVQVCVL